MIGLHYRLKEKMETIMVMGELRGGTLSTEAVTSTGEAASNLEAVSNNLSVSNPCLTNWGDFYMDIYQINHAIEKISGECAFLRDETRKTYLGQLYGLRAFYYFHLLRTWGGVPLCDKPDVLQTGDLTTLNKKRASEQETWNFIRKDIDTSCDMYAGLEYGNYNGANCYWNKAASQCLKAEVYLWGAKVKPIGGTGVLSPAETCRRQRRHSKRSSRTTATMRSLPTPSRRRTRTPIRRRSSQPATCSTRVRTTS